jgi:hypothetical protein
MSDDRNYEVGYGKPPVETRFRKGQSGNPAGRPRGSKNLATLFEAELSERIAVSENGRRKRITKQEAMVKHVVNKALSGDSRLLQLLLAEIRLIENRPESIASGEMLEAADLKVIRSFQERLRRLVQNGEANNGSDRD